MSYQCSVCGAEHPGPPWVWGPDSPLPWANLPDSVQADGELGSDQCIFPDGDAVRCFVRGRLEIPVAGTDDPFAWLVWIEVSQEAFRDMSEKWNQSGREQTPPYLGTLANSLSIYEQETLNLPVSLITRPLGERPLVVVTAEHRLRNEQTEGIREERIEEIASLLSH